MKIALFGKVVSKESIPFIQNVITELEKRDVGIIYYAPFFEKLRKHIALDSSTDSFTDSNGLKKSVDFLFSIGGDGTLLDTITYIQDSGIPVFGINLGRMGFLSSVSKDQIFQAINQLLTGKFKLDQRTLLRLETESKLFGNLNYAMNEFSVYKKHPVSMIKIQAFVNDEFLNSYWADGLIIATPTGSTAYSLSAGGPIIFPQSQNFVITPIATHNLTVRPVVIPDNSIIKIKVVGGIKEVIVSLDSRSLPVDSETELVIKKENFVVNLVQLDDESYFKTIRDKLMWGLDLRN
jgi:NAD+ kinase